MASSGVWENVYTSKDLYDLPSVNNTKKFGNKFKNIVYYNIPDTPSNVGVFGSITFSHTPEEAMSSGLAKACVTSKN